MHPEQIIDSQADLLNRFEEPAFRRTYEANMSVMKGDDGDVRTLMIATRNHVKAAYAYRVTADMVDLLKHAAESLDDEDIIDVGLPPTGCGIVYFEKPLMLTDARGTPNNIDWATWGPIEVQDKGRDKAALFTTFWNDLRKPDSVSKRMMHDVNDAATFGRILGQWSIIGGGILVDGRKLQTAYLRPGRDYEDQIREEGDTPAPYTNTDRLMYALWLLLNQTITDVSEEYVRKTSAKRAWRMGLPGRVSVIQLRRVEHKPSDEHGSVEWQHRWIVRGHWRWVPCGTGKTERRRQWIQPHVKGPEGKPFMQSEKLYDLSR